MRIRFPKRRLWLCVAPAVFTLLDQTLTLAGQAPEYWAGNFAYVNEGSPHGHWALAQHPLVFELGILLWVALFGAAIVLLPRLPALIVSLAVTMGHAWGASTWLGDFLGYWGCIALFFAAAALVVFTWEKGHYGRGIRFPPTP